MRRLIANTGLPARLVAVVVVLIILTTLSAGAPAYLLARRQLAQQAWERVDGTRRATESLYEATLERVVDLTTLLAERPTLRRLMNDRAGESLEPYLETFLEQSDPDFITGVAQSILDADGQPIVSTLPLGPVVATLKETERYALAIPAVGSGAVALAGAVLGAWLIRRLTAPLNDLTLALAGNTGLALKSGLDL